MIALIKRLLDWVFEGPTDGYACVLCDEPDVPMAKMVTPEGLGPPSPEDGWRQMVVDGGLLLFAQPGATEPLRLTLNQARARMPDWEFALHKQGDRVQVWAR